MDTSVLLLALENAMRPYYVALRTALNNFQNETRLHVDDLNNPHMVDKEQIGLGFVQNYPIATEIEAQLGTNNHAYMTPLRVAQAIAVLGGGGGGGGDASVHIANMSNPHNTTKAQVGLGSVENYGIASEAQARAGTATTVYVTPLRVAQAIETLIGVTVSTHIANTSNPHNVTKAQVGLSSVENYGIATELQARAGAVNDVYMTPLRVAQAIETLGGGNITAHLADTANPHSVTKTQVGLGSVENYGIASQVDAEAGTSNLLYTTPLRVAQAINALVGTTLTSHISNTNNPHGTTKAHVGLGSVDNYATASQAEAEAGVATNRFMTPQRVAQAIVALGASGDASAHIVNTSNPHNVTKAQVGLGSVENYAVATQIEAEAGTLNTVYMTSLRVAQAVTAQVGGTLTTLNTNINNHVSNTANPHGTTKTHVGLGSVENYGIATQAVAEAGTSNVVYMTPLRTAQAISVLIGGTVTTLSTNLNTHTTNTNNPHGTTKAHVGLSSVDNYATASQVEAETGTATNRFMTPQRVAQAITVLIGNTVTAHISNTSNPHGTTKTHVGLGSVENYGIATQIQAQAGTATNVYMTPLRTAEAIAALAISSARTLTITNGAGITGGAAFDLSANRSWTLGLSGQALALHSLATNGIITRTAANTVTSRSIAASGVGLSVTNSDGVAGNPTITSNATNTNTASTIVARDANGDFSASTASLTGLVVAGAAGTAVGPLTSRLTVPNTVGNRAGLSVLTAAGGTLAGIAAEVMTVGGASVAVGKLDLWVQNAAITTVGLSIAGSGAVTIPGTLGVTGSITGALSGNASTATTLQTTRTIWGQNFNGSANVTGAASGITTLGMSGQLTNTVAVGTAPFVITSTTRVANLNVATAGTADTLTTARTINGTSFNGSANITTSSWGTSRTLSFTGDVTGSSAVDGSGNVATALTLANSGVTAGTYNNVATEVRPFTVDAKGRITAIGAAVTIAPAWGSITGKPTTLAGYGITDAATSAALTSHTGNTSNPHNTTKAHVGLGSVENYSIASQVEAEAGTATNRYMTPQRVAQAIAALGGGSSLTLATQVEAETGVNNTAYMSPLRSYQQLDALVLIPLADIFEQAALDLA